MPKWSNELPHDKKHMAFDLIRTPTEKPLVGIITCDAMTITQTHFWGGRTIPHEDDCCAACLQCVPYRTHVYVSAFLTKTREHILFECTEHAALAFEDHFNAHGTLRGCFFQASRPKKTPNGKVIIETKTADLTKVNLPTAPDVKRALCVIWRVPLPAIDAVNTSGSKRRFRMDKEKMASMNEHTVDMTNVMPISDILEGKANGRTKL